MKRSLRQDAEHRGPKEDLVLYGFSSGVCWRLPVPSAINPHPPQPTPTHIDSLYSISDVCCCGSRVRSSPRAYSILSLLGVAVYCALTLEGSASCLSALRRGDRKFHQLCFFKERWGEPFSLKFRNQFAPQRTIKLKTKKPLWIYRREFYPLRAACRLIRVMTSVHTSTQQKQQKMLLFLT